MTEPEIENIVTSIRDNEFRNESEGFITSWNFPENSTANRFGDCEWIIGNENENRTLEVYFEEYKMDIFKTSDHDTIPGEFYYIAYVVSYFYHSERRRIYLKNTWFKRGGMRLSFETFILQLC